MKYLLNILFFFCYAFSGPIEANSAKEVYNEGIAQAEHYVTEKGHRLRYAHFKTPLESKGTVVFVQGRGTFLEYYEIIIIPLLEQSFDVWMYDLSGQGGSSRLVSSEYHDQETFQYMQHIDSFEHYVDDLNAFVEDIVIPNAPGKLLLGGYSTGGHVALRYLQIKSATQPFQVGFMISPLLALKTPLSNVLPYLLWSASWFTILESYVPGLGHKDPILTMPYEGNPYSTDEAGFFELKQLCISNRHLLMGGVSYGWVKAAADSLSFLWSEKAIESIKIPILIATAGNDEIVDVSYNVKFVNELPQGHHIYIQEGRHELFREKAEIKKLLQTQLDQFLLGT